MNELFRSLLDFLRGLRPWVTIVPWEEGVRIRLGKSTRTLTAGVHWKLPFLDRLYVLPIRRQFVNLPLLDLVTAAGQELTIGLTVGFKVANVAELLNSVSQPEDAISDMVSSFCARYVRWAPMFEADRFEAAAAENLTASIRGLGEISVAVTSLSRGRRYRLIMDRRWSSWAATMDTKER